MNTSFPTEETIRRYLLGKLDSQADLENRLSEQVFVDDKLSEIVDMIEDEILEEYLDGRCSPADRRPIEEYFLRPPERKEKLELARLLRDHFNIKADAVAKKKRGAGRETAERFPHQSPGALVPLWRFHIRTYYGLAACFLLIALSAIYVSRISRGWQAQLEATRKTQAQLEGDLARERERSEALSRQLEQLRPSMVTLTFLGPVFRDRANTRVIEIRPWTKQLKVEIGLPVASPGGYTVRLETKSGKVIRSLQNVTASSGALRFEVPTEGISTGTYCLVVSSRPEPYCFKARVTPQAEGL